MLLVSCITCIKYALCVTEFKTFRLYTMGFEARLWTGTQRVCARPRPPGSATLFVAASALKRKRKKKKTDGDRHQLRLGTHRESASRPRVRASEEAGWSLARPRGAAVHGRSSRAALRARAAAARGRAARVGVTRSGRRNIAGAVGERPVVLAARRKPWGATARPPPRPRGGPRGA